MIISAYAYKRLQTFASTLPSLSCPFKKLILEENSSKDMILLERRGNVVCFVFFLCLQLAQTTRLQELDEPALQDTTAMIKANDQVLDLKGAVKFFVYTAHDQEEPIVVDTMDASSASVFGGDSKVTFLVHGFQTANEETFKELKKTLLSIPEPNSSEIIKPNVVVLVDWSKLSNAGFEPSVNILEFTGYLRAASKTEYVGQQICKLLQVLFARGVDPNNVHMVGFSLGAHSVGWAGYHTQRLERPFKIGRITGLDPAGPKFEKRRLDKRYAAFEKDKLSKIRDFHLSRDHAHFVDIIHTSEVLGFREPIGHVDFYPNGGTSQRCGLPSFLCSHSIVKKYFAASLLYHMRNHCKFEALKCPSFEEYQKFTNGEASACTSQTLEMGFYSKLNYKDYVQSGGKYYLYTKSIFPYCDKSGEKTPVRTSLFSRLRESSTSGQGDVSGPRTVLFSPIFFLIWFMFVAATLTFCIAYVLISGKEPFACNHDKDELRPLIGKKSEPLL